MNGVSASGVGELRLENNIFVGAMNDAVAIDGVSSSNFTDRSNVFSVSGAHLTWGTTRYTTYTDFKAATGVGSGSVEVDPLLTSTSPTAPDFSLQPSSPVRDLGVADPATGVLSPGCDGGVDRYCGAAPEPGARELVP
jgi:hypothetical protein